MIRKITILTLLIVCLSACSSVKPTTSETVTPKAQINKKTGQDLAIGSNTRTSQNTPPTKVGDLKMTILYDDTVFDSRLRADHGFAMLIEHDGHTLMFDTGAKGAILLYNMQKLGVEPRSIEAIVLSHEHGDHIGGLQAILNKGDRPTVYVSSAFSSAFKKRVSEQTKLVEVTDALAVFPCVYMTQPVGSIVEQALVMDTRNGSIVITGCAHPGVARMVREAQKVVPGEIALLVGGFHLLHASKNRLRHTINELRHLGVKRILPAHCTGEEGIAFFKVEYGKNCIGGGVGREITSLEMKSLSY